MNQLVILFHDPNFGILIEDALEDTGVSYTMNKTPETLLEKDPFYCKTFIMADISVEDMKHLQQSKQLTIAAIYIVSNGRYEAVMNEVA